MKNIIYLILFSFSFFICTAQKYRENSANKNYNDFSFYKAQKKYLKLKNLDKNPNALLNLANTYYFNSDYKQALHWYYKYFEIKPVTAKDKKNTNVYRFIQTLKANNEAALVQIVLDAIGHGDTLTLKTIPYFDGNYSVSNSSINQDNDTFGLSFLNYDKKEIIFSSNRTNKELSDAKHLWNNKPYLKFYTAKINDKDDIVEPKLLEGEINTYLIHQSNPTISKDGKRMYFTRSIPQKSINGNSYLRLYTADFIDGKWSKPYELPAPINLENSSSAHPCISPDNKLYFISNRNNSPENSDIYYVNLNEYYTPIKEMPTKLSNKINTIGREDFIYVSDDGILYFSSDGHNGFGGLDIFAASYDGTEYHILNLGEPINSVADDFSFIINAQTKKGFFSSNRENNKNDKIYKLTENKPLNWNYQIKGTLYGTLTDSISKLPIANAKLTFIQEENNEVIKELLTDEKGFYSLEVPTYKKIQVTIEADNYTIKKYKINPLENAQKFNANFEIFNEKIIIVNNEIVTLKSGDDLSKLLKLNPIYFDYNGFSIRKSSKLELDKVIDLLAKRPSVTVEIRSHTDSRGSDQYNLTLSENRAKTTLEYIVNEGKIDPNRLSSKGYGETNLFIVCRNCSDEEHQLNRRSEFIIHFNNE